MDKICLHVIVSGRVQGVFYRDKTRKKARELNITGFVRNLTDGSVEVTACGSEKQMDQFLQWLKKGPPLARVDQLISQKVELQEYPSFEIH